MTSRRAAVEQAVAAVAGAATDGGGGGSGGDGDGSNEGEGATAGRARPNCALTRCPGAGEGEGDAPREERACLADRRSRMRETMSSSSGNPLLSTWDATPAKLSGLGGGMRRVDRVP
jgi:hypothetical protein